MTKLLQPAVMLRIFDEIDYTRAFLSNSLFSVPFFNLNFLISFKRVRSK